jgi:hypothetical protein
MGVGDRFDAVVDLGLEARLVVFHAPKALPGLSLPSALALKSGRRGRGRLRDSTGGYCGLCLHRI